MGVQFLLGSTLLALTVLSVQGLSYNTDETRFLFYRDKSNHHEIKLGDVSSLSSSGLRDATQTVFIIDGFLSDGTTPMSQETKNAFLNKYPNTNVVVVDWGALSGSGATLENPVATFILYSNVVKNVGPLGQRIADFISFLKVNKKVEFSQVQIVGHSLGAHVAGAAGQSVQTKYSGLISKITGLDPAGPLFSTQIDPKKRLYKGDAAFVELYHTNRGINGDSALRTGNINVFVNGGASQPGCAEADVSGYKGFCSHSFSWKLFNASFNTVFTACPCSENACVVCASCDLTCDGPVLLGNEVSSSTSGDYYLKTGPIP